MAEKHVVVQGAQCMCNFGTAPDKLKVLTNDKDFANDSQGSKKPMATTMDIGTTFEKNMFGSCSKMNNKPCNAIVQSWSGFYPDTILSNGGKVLLEDSKASCPIGGADCIRVIQHGQQAEPSQKNMDNSSREVQGQLNPMATMIADQGSFDGIEVATR